MVPLRINTLTLSDGTTIPMEGGSIVVIVGPNNVGKSRALREIHGHFTTPTPPLAVVLDIDVAKLVDASGLESWLRDNAHVIQRGLTEIVGRPFAGEFDINEVTRLWNSGPPFQQVGAFYALLANTEQRLGLAASRALLMS